MAQDDPTDQPGRWDHLTYELQALRTRSGEVSYQEIARRIRENRMARGMSEYSARVARSTVHFSFSTGRARINFDLVREIVEALGEDPALVDRWMAEPRERGTGPEPTAEPSPPKPSHGAHIALLLLACLIINLVGREFVDFFRLPVYLDMAGTAVAAIALGPWWGVLVGLTTNTVGVVGSGWISLPFALVNMTGALVWGYGVHRWGMGRTLARFFGLNLLAALACSVVAVPVIVALLDDKLRVGHDAITTLTSETIDTLVVAVGFSNILTSTGDKLVSGFFALVVVSALPLGLRRGADLVAVDPTPLSTPHTRPTRSP